MSSVTKLEAGPEVFHEYLKPTPEMKWPPLSVCIDADVCLDYEIYAHTGAFKIRGGTHYFERFTRGNAKALDLIYALSSNYIRNPPYASTRQKVPSAIRVSDLSKAEKNLAVTVLPGDGRPRGSQKVVLCAPAGIKTQFF